LPGWMIRLSKDACELHCLAQPAELPESLPLVRLRCFRDVTALSAFCRHVIGCLLAANCQLPSVILILHRQVVLH